MSRKLTFATLALAAGLSAQAQADTIYSSYVGSQLGVTQRNPALVQTGVFTTGLNINGIGIGGSNDLYLAGGNQLFNYTTGGTLINTMTFPDPGINYTDVAYSNGVVAATYDGSQQGITLRDSATLNQFAVIGTGVDATGIAFGGNNDLYITAGDQIINYALNGALINTMTFGFGILYTDVDYADGIVVASYGGTQQGFTVRTPGLVQTLAVTTGFTATGIALGSQNDVYLSSGNNLYRYGLDGTLITQMTFPDDRILYTGVTVARVPEPGTMLLLGAGLLGLAAVRRRKAA